MWSPREEGVSTGQLVIIISHQFLQTFNYHLSIPHYAKNIHYSSQKSIFILIILPVVNKRCGLSSPASHEEGQFNS